LQPAADDGQDFPERDFSFALVIEAEIGAPG
jgi:hypothetical protein